MSVKISVQLSNYRYKYIHIYIYTYTCIYAYVCVAVCLYVCMPTCLYVCTSMYVCMSACLYGMVWYGMVRYGMVWYVCMRISTYSMYIYMCRHMFICVWGLVAARVCFRTVMGPVSLHIISHSAQRKARAAGQPQPGDAPRPLWWA